MTNSQFCLQQRQKEQQRFNKLLILGFVGSAAIHGVLAYALPKWSFEPPERAEEPMELILVDRPTPEPKSEPKIESKPVVEPEPVKPPEPVQAQTPPPKPAPEPVQAQTPPPKPAPEPTPEPAPQPAPKEVLTTPTPVPSQPIVSAPIENSRQSSSLSRNFTSSNSSAISNSESPTSSSNEPGGSGSTVATNSAPPRPQTNDRGKEGISCVSNCQPEYPAALDGVEGSAGVKLTVNSSGNVIGAELINPNSNSGVNRQALLAARQMQFSSPGSKSAAVRVSIDFTVAGSEYDRARRAEQRRREQAERERQEQEAARQRQLEAERQAQQEQLERERQARQEQLQQQQQQPEPTSSPTQTQPEPAAPPTPAPLNNKVDDEMLRKFRERIEQYQEE